MFENLCNTTIISNSLKTFDLLRLIVCYRLVQKIKEHKHTSQPWGCEFLINLIKRYFRLISHLVKRLINFLNTLIMISNKISCGITVLNTIFSYNLNILLSLILLFNLTYLIIHLFLILMFSIFMRKLF